MMRANANEAIHRVHRSAVVAMLIAALSPGARALAVSGVIQQPGALFQISVTQGYLGVDVADVDQKSALALKLKEVRGAVITLIDHDAPAGQIGLRVNDVVVKLNGQSVEGAEQLRRMLREIPAGRAVTLEFSRDGVEQSVSVQLADRQAMEQDVWNRIGSGGVLLAPMPSSTGSSSPLLGNLHIPFFSTLNVGVTAEPLTHQMAASLGIPGGLIVKEIAPKSEADVILKAGAVSILSLGGWERALRAYQGKPLQVVVLRDHKQLTLTLQVDSKRHSVR
jgi:S1-C subfamily serine protease